MTARHLASVTPSEIQDLASDNGADIEIDTAANRAYVRIGQVTYAAELEVER